MYHIGHKGKSDLHRRRKPRPLYCSLNVANHTEKQLLSADQCISSWSIDLNTDAIIADGLMYFSEKDPQVPSTSDYGVTWNKGLVCLFSPSMTSQSPFPPVVLNRQSSGDRALPRNGNVGLSDRHQCCFVASRQNSKWIQHQLSATCLAASTGSSIIQPHNNTNKSVQHWQFRGKPVTSTHFLLHACPEKYFSTVNSFFSPLSASLASDKLLVLFLRLMDNSVLLFF